MAAKMKAVAALACALAAAHCGTSDSGKIPDIVSLSPTPTAPKPPPFPRDFAYRWFRSPLSVEDAEQILIRTQWFAVGMMGPKRQVQAYNAVFDRPDARQRFEAIAAQAGVPGKVYAWCGLMELKADSAIALESEILKSRGRIPVADSDVVDQESPAELIDLAKRRTFCAQMRANKAETSAAFATQLPRRIDDAVNVYMVALTATDSVQSGQIEKAIDALGQLREILMTPSGGGTLLEHLTGPEFTTLNRNLPGVILHRTEIVGLVPDVEYFGRLAASSGNEVDRAFFAALKITRPQSVWPDYNERQTDYSGCIRFGTLRLVDVYRAWSEFTKKYPGRYSATASHELEDVANAFTAGTCACRNRSAIDRELDAFVKAFPASSIRPQVELRLRDLRAGRANFLENCQSG